MTGLAIGLLGALAGAAVVALVGVFSRSYARKDAAPTPQAPAYDDRWIKTDLLNVSEAIEKLVGLIRDQGLAIDEGISRVERSERRVRASVARARKKLADAGFEDDAIEAEAEGLRLVDGSGSEAQGVLPLPDEVGGVSEELRSAIPGDI